MRGGQGRFLRGEDGGGNNISSVRHTKSTVMANRHHGTVSDGGEGIATVAMWQWTSHNSQSDKSGKAP